MHQEISTGHVLLVEDNEAHAELVTAALSHAARPVRVSHAGDGEEALDMLLGPPAPEALLPDLVLLDLRLPRVDGLEVLARVRADGRLNRLPVVVLTTSSALPDVERAYELGANSYLVKRSGFDELSRMLEAAADYWLGLNRDAHEHAQAEEVV